MLRASSFYLVIVVSAIIAILTGSLISVAFFYRQESLKNARYDRLNANLRSGIAIGLSADSVAYDVDDTLDLFGEQADSIIIRREAWGLYDLALCKSFESLDTLAKAFLVAKEADSDKTVIYLNDEDRPLSVSGSTMITGEAILPKSGVRAAHVDGKSYSGGKLVNGPVKISKRELPRLDPRMLKRIGDLFSTNTEQATRVYQSAKRPFFEPLLVVDLGGGIKDLSGISFEGKILLVSDTTVRISKSTRLKDVIICAPSITVEAGFEGSCQLFAKDSIVTGKNVNFIYPSVMGVLKPEGSAVQAKIELGEGSRFSGALFSYEKNRTERMTIVSAGKNSHIKGEIYASGFLKLEKPVRIDGKVLCNRFIIRTSTTLYENYLIDITLNRPARSKYYLSSELFNHDERINKVLKWLN